jgi:Tfp pilus assembly protein PilX
MVMKKPRSTNTNEFGFASLVVAFILILVMSLLTVGFAQIARREQQSALDKQLANQAYYAAETGVNEIKAQIPALTTAWNTGTINANTCLGSPFIQNPSAGNPNVGVIDAASDVTYTCALVNMTPSTLVSSNSSTPGTTATNFTFSTAGALNNLTFSWGSADTTPNNSPTPNNVCSNGCDPTQATWQAYHSPAVVQLSITPLGNGTITRTALIDSTFTAYLYPTNDVTPGGDPYNRSWCPAVSETTNYAPDSGSSTSCNAQITGANYNSTNSTYPFSVTINLAAASPQAGESWLVHYVNYYDSITSCLQAGTSGGCLTSASSTSSTTDFKGGEIIVDVTGKAKNVTKRLVEYLPATTTTSASTVSTANGVATVPPYAIEGANVCKEFATNPAAPGAGTVANTNYTAGITSANYPSDCTLGP